MKRYGLIIANPGEIGAENYCEGVNQDVRNYEKFLCSPLGGAWNQSEITVLNKPSVNEVRNAIYQAKQADYAFIVFAGHGYYSSNKKSTILALRAGVEIDSNELKQGAKKQTLILDCCRKIERTQLIEKRAALAFEEFSDLNANRIQCRKNFDSAIESCHDDLIVAHSCSIDETAGDNSEKGGWYSYSLIDNAIELSKRRIGAQSLSIIDAHESAKVQVIRLSGSRQTPVIEKPRSSPYFPFSVVA